MDVTARLDALQEENARLHERIAYLESSLGLDFLAPAEYGLTPKESAVLGVLMSRELAKKETVMLAVYQDMDTPEIKIVDVFICKIRKKLEPFGLGIETRWGLGYYLTPDTKRKIEARMAEISAANLVT